jgi:hypothetical protein
LSLIVPFQCDSQALENTLVSVLEVRAADDELIIVHRGEYQDPYGLSGDEARVIETAASSSLAEQLNTAYRGASGEVIQVVVPGTILESDWCDDALAAFDELDVDMIGLGIKTAGSQVLQYGFESDAMPQRRLTTEASKIAGPMLGGTLIRRSTLECLGGWNSKIPSDLIDFEMSMMAKVLGLHVGVVEGALIQCQEARSMVLSHYEQGRSVGQLACAFSEKSDSAITVEPLVKRLGHLASGLVNPKLAAERLGWVLGVRDRSWVEPIGKRIELARKALAERQSSWEDRPAVLSNPGFQGSLQDKSRKAA